MSIPVALLVFLSAVFTAITLIIEIIGTSNSESHTLFTRDLGTGEGAAARPSPLKIFSLAHMSIAFLAHFLEVCEHLWQGWAKVGAWRRGEWWEGREAQLARREREVEAAGRAAEEERRAAQLALERAELARGQARLAEGRAQLALERVEERGREVGRREKGMMEVRRRLLGVKTSRRPGDGPWGRRGDSLF